MSGPWIKPRGEKLKFVFKKRQPIRIGARIGRNKPCPCNSGLKFKHCCKTKERLLETLTTLTEKENDESTD